LERRVDKLENDENKVGLKGEDKNQGEVLQVATEVAKEIMEEYKERERRKLHIVFQNLPESENDKEEIQRIMREIGISAAVNDTERVGVKREGQHRTLRMCCDSLFRSESALV
jgi:pimeloyl-CoA synthetase